MAKDEDNFHQCECGYKFYVPVDTSRECPRCDTPYQRVYVVGDESDYVVVPSITIG